MFWKKEVDQRNMDNEIETDLEEQEWGKELVRGIVGGMEPQTIITLIGC